MNDLKEYKLMVFGDNGFASVSESFDKDYKRSPYEKPMTKAERVALVAVNRCDVRSNMSNAIELKALNGMCVCMMCACPVFLRDIIHVYTCSL